MPPRNCFSIRLRKSVSDFQLQETKMNTVKKYTTTLPLIALCLLILGSAAGFAQNKFMMLRSGRPDVKVMLSGTVERDDAKVPVEKAVMVKSGETLGWTITSVNEGNAPANEYSAVGKIPAGTQFVAGSASAEGSAAVTFSIDSGKSFSAAPTVDQRQADGSVKKVAAPLSMYNQVRYAWATPLNEGAQVNASYKVRVN
jgi:uncharacterized repeat protein (TIGR01451 family)